MRWYLVRGVGFGPAAACRRGLGGDKGREERRGVRGKGREERRGVRGKGREERRGVRGKGGVRSGGDEKRRKGSRKREEEQVKRGECKSGKRCKICVERSY